MLKVLLFQTLFVVTTIKCQFFDCHDDPVFEPNEGPLQELMYTWLGALQYIHVKNGTPNYFRVPRVVLISRQFVLSTAVDAAQIPDGFALGNVIFGDYERDENECQFTMLDLAKGADCEPAVMLMPISDVLLHPEYKHFNARNSVALLKLLKPLRSEYMVPACLPFKDYIIDKYGRQSKEKLFHIDFFSDVPRDFFEESKELIKISWLPKELCYLYDTPFNGTNVAKNRAACSTGCGLHSGAPTVVHEHSGHWTVVAISEGGSPCLDPLRSRRPPAPPRHILIHPYVPWITAAITGKAVGAFSKDDPFGYVMPRSHVRSPYDFLQHEWIGHWWMGGLRCKDRGEAASDLFRFYHEVFLINPIGPTYLSYYLEIDAPHEALIICVKVGLPYRLGQPRVWELDTPMVKVRVPLIRLASLYKMQIEAFGYNATESSTSSDSDSSSSSTTEEDHH